MFSSSFSIIIHFLCFISSEIPDFLTDEECKYIIQKAESTGLFTSDIMDGATDTNDQDEGKYTMIPAQWYYNDFDQG